MVFQQFNNDQYQALSTAALLAGIDNRNLDWLFPEPFLTGLWLFRELM
jgi:hypothetical protein